jgi:hypothetical protein
MGVLIRLLQVEKNIWHHIPPTTFQYSSSMFATTFKDFTNNHYTYWDQLSCLIIIVAKHDKSIPTSRKALSNAKLRVTHERGTCGLGF